jgi:hypothetical protein
MITDNFLRLSGSLTAGSATGQTITATANSTNVVDLLLARDIGEGEELYVAFTVGTAFATGTSLTMAVIVTADPTSFGTPTTIGTSGAVAVANLTAGAMFAVRLNPQIASLGLRYLGVIYTVGGSNFTTGTMTADIVTEIQDGKKYYASGIPTLSNT